MSAAQVAVAEPGLAIALVQGGKLRSTEADEIGHGGRGRAFVDALLAAGKISALDLAEFVAQYYSLPLADLDAVDPATVPIESIDLDLAQSARVLPLRLRRNRVIVAVADPTDAAALNEIRAQTALAVETQIAAADKLDALIARALRASVSQQAPGSMRSDMPNMSAGPEDAPVARFIQKMLTDAIAEGATALHFESQASRFRVRIRAGGALRDWIQPPIALRERIVRRLKLLVNLADDPPIPLSEGRSSIALGPDRMLDLRLSTVPTVDGEKIVLELTDAVPAPRAIDALGLLPVQRELLLIALRERSGLVLVCGPPRSGKTTTLYSLATHLDQPGASLVTIEAPVRAALAGVSQIAADPDQGLDFASLLRTVLRLDTDIVALSTISDGATARIAVKAAQSGQLILARMHSVDGPDAFARLMDFGVAAGDIAASVKLVTTQRLVRQLCECKSPDNVSDESLLFAGFPSDEVRSDWRPFAPVGCDRCKGSGFRGRLAVFHVGLGAAEAAGELRASGLAKVKAGLTSLDEVTTRT